jgi:hypothetical protein
MHVQANDGRIVCAAELPQCGIELTIRTSHAFLVFRGMKGSAAQYSGSSSQLRRKQSP